MRVVGGSSFTAAHRKDDDMENTVKAKRTARERSPAVRVRAAGFTAATRRAFAEADADFEHYVKTGSHKLPAYSDLDSLFASWN